MTRTPRSLRLLVATVALSCLLPFAASAAATSSVAKDTSQTDLHAAVKAALLADPRTSHLSSQQINAMVEALTTQAQKQGMTPHEIFWRPVVAAPVVAGSTQLPGVPTMSACGDPSSILCRLNFALGLDGSNLLIPILLGVATLVMFLIVGLLITHHKKHDVPVVPPPLF